MSKNLNGLPNKICLITGAARGIGLNIARAMGKKGFILAISDVDEKILNHSKQQLGQPLRYTLCNHLLKVAETKLRSRPQLN